MNMVRQGQNLEQQNENLKTDNDLKLFNLNNLGPLKEGLMRNQGNLAGKKSEYQGMLNDVYLETGKQLQLAKLSAAQELFNKYRLSNQQSAMDIDLRNIGVNPKTQDPFLYYLSRPSNDGKNWKIPTYIGTRLGLDSFGEIMQSLNPLSRFLGKGRIKGSTTSKFGNSTVTTYDY